MSAAATADLKHFFFDENLATALTAGVQETIYEMCRLPCDFEGNFIAQHWIPSGHATSSVELISEQQKGLLQLHFSDVAALTIMAKLLGRAPMAVNDDALDCIGSLTGIIYGRMKAILNPQGYKFMMALPKMHYTAKLKHPEGNIRHLIVPFRVGSSKCFIQVVFYA